MYEILFWLVSIWHFSTVQCLWVTFFGHSVQSKSDSSSQFYILFLSHLSYPIFPPLPFPIFYPRFSSLYFLLPSLPFSPFLRVLSSSFPSWGPTPLVQLECLCERCKILHRVRAEPGRQMVFCGVFWANYSFWAFDDSNFVQNFPLYFSLDESCAHQVE